mgnify:CR=1 FL=1
MTVSQPLRRVQVLLPPKTYDMLQEIAAEKKESVSALVRQAVEDQLIKELREQRKLAAVDRLEALDLPIDDWPAIEAEMAESRYSGHDD